MNVIVLAAMMIVFSPAGALARDPAPKFSDYPARAPDFLTGSAMSRGQEPNAPQLTLTDLNGRTVRLSDYHGKVVLINFWATWCPPCRAEMPDLVKLQREHGKEGLQIIGITYPPEKKTRVRRFAKS